VVAYCAKTAHLAGDAARCAVKEALTLSRRREYVRRVMLQRKILVIVELKIKESIRKNALSRSRLLLALLPLSA